MINVSWSFFPNYGSHYNPVITGSITVIAAVVITYCGVKVFVQI